MTAPPDPASAARRVADAARKPGHVTLMGGESITISAADLLALLPVLDAVARGAEGDRVERMARVLYAVLAEEQGAETTFDDCLAVQIAGRQAEYPHRTRWLGIVMAQARAAIALADAEAAGGWCFDMAAAPRDGTSILASDADGGLYVVDWDEALNENAKASGHCWWGTEGSGKYGFHTSTFVAWCLPPAPPSTRP